MPEAHGLPQLFADGTRRLTAADLEAVSTPVAVVLSEDVRARVVACEKFVADAAASGRQVYGLTTGYGPLVAYSSNPDPGANSRGLVSFLQASQGPPLPEPIVRAMLLARIWSLSAGRSGIHLSTLETVVRSLATSLTPVVPELGSVGASGDLSPLAHAAGALMGMGEAFVDGVRLPAAEALKLVGLAPLELRGRDGLALVNGTSLTASAAGLAARGAQRAIDVALRLSALLTETVGAELQYADHDLLLATGHQDLAAIADRLHGYLRGAIPSGKRGLQEPYSIRCVPQLVGGVQISVRHAGRVAEDDLNGVNDNPMFFAELDKIAHGGNFFGQAAGLAADSVNVAAVQLANLAERQLDLMMDPNRNGGLNPLLSADPGVQSGITGVNITTTAIVGHMRRLVTPSSTQSLPTNMHNQDIVPFSTQAALEAWHQVERLRWVHGALAVALRQAAYVGGCAPCSEAGTALLAQLSDLIPPVDPDRPLDQEVRQAADAVYAIANPAA